MANHQAGSILTPTVRVLSSHVDSNGTRTIVLTRKISNEYYTFDPFALSVPVILAVGSSSTFAYHKEKTTSMLTLRPKSSSSSCLCLEPPLPFGQNIGVFEYLPTGEKVGMQTRDGVRCPSSPRTDLLTQRNPTCDMRTYVVFGARTTTHSISRVDSLFLGYATDRHDTRTQVLGWSRNVPSRLVSSGL